jgi:tRNA A-37 threonylcarbamoyl transferase component Bud32
MVNRIRRKTSKNKRTVLRKNPKSRKVTRVRKSSRKKRSKKSFKKKKTKKKRSRKPLVGGSSDEEWPTEAYSPPSEWMGQGAFGYVYKAKVLGPEGDEVCIKRLSIGTEEERSLYEKEVAILKSIKGIPGTVILRNYYEDVEGEDTYGYIVMECVDGHNLSECAGKFEYGEERPIFRKILETLEQIHEKGIVHNDLHFKNIMVKHCEPGTPVTIVDFGQASMEKDFDKLRIREITNLILLVAEKMNGHARSAVIESFKLYRDPFPTIQELLDHPWFIELEPGYFKEWVQLTETERKATGILGFTPKTWDDGWKHDGMIRKFLRENKWQSLTDTQQEAAANLGLEETDFTGAASGA